MDIAVIAQNIGTVIATVGLQILGAIVMLIVGRWLIGVVVRLLERSLERQKVDPTVLRYVDQRSQSLWTLSWLSPFSATSVWRRSPSPRS